MRIFVRTFKFRITIDPRRCLRVIVGHPIGTSRHRVFRTFLFPSGDKGVLMKALVKIMYFLCTICPSPFPRLLIVLPRGDRRNGQFLSSALSYIFSRFDHSRPRTISCPLVVSNGLAYRIVCNAIRNGNVLTPSINATFLQVPSAQVSESFNSCLYPFNVGTRLTR